MFEKQQTRAIAKMEAANAAERAQMAAEMAQLEVERLTMEAEQAEIDYARGEVGSSKRGADASALTRRHQPFALAPLVASVREMRPHV